MIKAYFAIKNPFWKYSMDKLFKSYFCWTVPVTKNKTFELQLVRHFYYLFSVDFDTTFKGEDHAGPECEINIFGYSLAVSLRDNRHWDDDKGDWYD